TKVNSENSVSFNYPKFTPSNSGLTLQGSAKVSDSGVLELTRRTGSDRNVGRVVYTNPIPIWDKKTDNLASFVSSFSFIMETIAGSSPAQGIIFFLTDPSGFQIPSHSFVGKLGVVDANRADNNFVGVEFDVYSNPWDPNYTHIGINPYGLYSSKLVKWNYVSGSLVNVKIIYDSHSTTLSVVAIDNRGQISTISLMVDLRCLLSETAVIGLSGSSGISRSSGNEQLHNIHSWSFTSTLDPTIRLMSSNIINNITVTDASYY
ncbi:legume lectin beta domain protein, partial [Trifolium medium]|nr:legume lectin beta domain protein [Trifolium medium]